MNADLPPVTLRARLTIGGVPCGTVEDTLARQMAAASLPVVLQGDDWAIEGTPDESLALIAQWLHRHGHGGKWRDEFLAVTSDSGEVLATVERAAVRALGIATHAVHLIGVTPSNQVWVQRRALDKAVDPACWTRWWGASPRFAESTHETLEREAWEEAGLRLNDLQGVRNIGRLIVRRPVSDGYMVEHIEIFSAQVPDGTVPQNQDGEVMGFECMNAEALRDGMRNGQFTFDAALIHAHWLQQANSRPA